MKKYWLSILLICGTIIFAAGGLLLPAWLMDKQQEKILAGTGSIPLPAVAEEAEENTDNRKEPMRELAEDKEEALAGKLSAKELVEAAQSYLSDGSWFLYEPVEGQISLEEALIIAKAAMENFCERGILPEEFHSLSTAGGSAILGTKWEQDQITKNITPEKGCWIIQYIGETIHAEIYMNAANGKILSFRASGYFNREQAFENSVMIMKQYVKYLGFEEEPQIHSIDELNHAVCGTVQEKGAAVWVVQSDLSEEAMQWLEVHLCELG